LRVVGNNFFSKPYLLALSATAYQYAATLAEENESTPDAELTLFLNELAVDLDYNGVLKTPDLIENLTRALRQLNPADIIKNLQDRAYWTRIRRLMYRTSTVFWTLCRCLGTHVVCWSTHATSVL